jgi:hypothetical protein
VELVALRRVAPRSTAQIWDLREILSVRSTRTGLSQRDNHYLREFVAKQDLKQAANADTNRTGASWAAEMK